MLRFEVTTPRSQPISEACSPQTAGPAGKCFNDKEAEMATQIKTTINGVAVDRMLDTIEAVKADPQLGESRWRTRNVWIDGGLNRSTIQDFYGAGREDASRLVPFVLDNDEPPFLLGENRAPNPVEYLLHGMAGCITTTFVYYAAAEGIEVEEVESTLEGDIDLRGLLGIAPINPGYQNIRMEMRVKADAPEAKLAELLDLAQRRSPAFNSVVRPVPTEVTLIKG
jgi:uncharacterized OsmC-like protein